MTFKLLFLIDNGRKAHVRDKSPQVKPDAQSFWPSALHAMRSASAGQTISYDWLSQHLFHSIEQVQQSATDWLWSYNHERPNMALGGITPIQRLTAAA